MSYDIANQTLVTGSFDGSLRAYAVNVLDLLNLRKTSTGCPQSACGRFCRRAAFPPTTSARSPSLWRASGGSERCCPRCRSSPPSRTRRTGPTSCRCTTPVEGCPLACVLASPWWCRVCVWECTCVVWAWLPSPPCVCLRPRLGGVRWVRVAGVGLSMLASPCWFRVGAPPSRRCGLSTGVFASPSRHHFSAPCVGAPRRCGLAGYPLACLASPSKLPYRCSLRM